MCGLLLPGTRRLSVVRGAQEVYTRGARELLH